HGFNRLGGNSLTETVVSGMIVGEFIADYIADAAAHFHYSERLVQQAVAEQVRLLSSFNGTENPAHIIRDMQTIMSEQVGIFRTREALEDAVAKLQTLRQRAA